MGPRSVVKIMEPATTDCREICEIYCLRFLRPVGYEATLRRRLHGKRRAKFPNMDGIKEKRKVFLSRQTFEFSNHCNLRRHLRQNHPNVLVEVDLSRDGNESNTLPQSLQPNSTCSFRSCQDLRKHLSDRHHLHQLEILKEFDNFLRGPACNTGAVLGQMSANDQN